MQIESALMIITSHVLCSAKTIFIPDDKDYQLLLPPVVRDSHFSHSQKYNAVNYSSRDLH